ncbi:hypothetical protein LUTEI9C_50051 [Luteimonas sp. 9C]|nr:hypothetical protein LUTEI9C_50051 [Luteimonas sp. 9C]
MRPRAAQRFPRPRLQGTRDSAACRRRLPHRAERTAHLAARPLHVHRAAQRREDIHRHPVPAAPCAGRRWAGLRPADRSRGRACVLRTRFPVRTRIDSGIRPRLAREPGRPAGYALSRSLASRRPSGPAGRRRARDGAVPRPGHELRVRGLRGTGPAPRRARGPRHRLRRVRGRAQTRCRRDPAHGARQLPGDARPRRRCRLPAAARTGTRPAGSSSRPVRAALRDGHLHADPLFAGDVAHGPATRDSRTRDGRARLVGDTRLGGDRCRRARPADAAGGCAGVSDSFLFYDRASTSLPSAVRVMPSQRLAATTRQHHRL